MPLTNTDLVNAYGNHYINEGQNMSRLLQLIRQKTVTTSHARPIVTSDTVWRLSKTELDEVLQPFQHKWTPKGTLKFKPVPIQLFRIKTDIELYPDKIVESWAGFLSGLDEQERKNWPLIRYAIEMEVVPKIHNDQELKAYYYGKYKEPTEGTPGSARDTMDGLQKLLNVGINNNGMIPVTLSETPSRTNMVDMIEEFTDQLDEALSEEPMIIGMSPSMKRNYFKDRRDTFGTNNNYSDEKAMTIDEYPNIEIVGLPSMSGTNEIFCTPRSNFFYLRRSNGMQMPLVQELKRQVFLMTDWWEGLGFGVNEMVYFYSESESSSSWVS